MSWRAQAWWAWQGLLHRRPRGRRQLAPGAGTPPEPRQGRPALLTPEPLQWPERPWAPKQALPCPPAQAPEAENFLVQQFFLAGRTTSQLLIVGKLSQLFSTLTRVSRFGLMCSKCFPLDKQSSGASGQASGNQECEGDSSRHVASHAGRLRCQWRQGTHRPGRAGQKRAACSGTPCPGWSPAAQHSYCSGTAESC